MYKILIASKRYSLHPDDKHLFIVLCEVKKDSGKIEYATWIRDDTKGDNDGCYYSNIQAAMESFNERGSI